MPVETDVPVRGNITTVGGAAGQVAVNVNGLANTGLFITLSGVTSGVFAFEASLDSTDGTNGTWFAAPGLRTDATALEGVSAALSATPAYGWQFDLTCYNYFRVRATGGTFGTAAVVLTPGLRDITNAVILAGGGTTASQVQGSQPRNTAPGQSGNPLYIATGRSTNITAAADGRIVDLRADLAGNLVVKPYSPNDLDFQVLAAAATPITTAATTTLKAAIATFRQYVTAIQLVNNSATATEIALQDTNGTPTVLWRTFLPANSVRDIRFPTPLRTGSGTASGISLVTVTTGCSVWWSMQGYVGY